MRCVVRLRARPFASRRRIPGPTASRTTLTSHSGRYATRSGAVALLIPEGHDITERKAAEESLRGSEERFRFLIQNQTEFVVSCLPDTTLTFVNDSYSRYVHLAPDAIVGTLLLDRVVSHDRERVDGTDCGTDAGRAGRPRGVSGRGGYRAASLGAVDDQRRVRERWRAGHAPADRPRRPRPGRCRGSETEARAAAAAGAEDGSARPTRRRRRARLQQPAYRDRRAMPTC